MLDRKEWRARMGNKGDVVVEECYLLEVIVVFGGLDRQSSTTPPGWMRLTFRELGPCGWDCRRQAERFLCVCCRMELIVVWPQLPYIALTRSTKMAHLNGTSVHLFICVGKVVRSGPHSSVEDAAEATTPLCEVGDVRGASSTTLTTETHHLAGTLVVRNQWCPF